jgi:FMN-dependent NADH-azoreductase
VKLIKELEQADAILIGAHVQLLDPVDPQGVAGQRDPARSRRGRDPLRPGHSGHRRRQPRRLLRPGTPREGSEFVQNYLEAVLKGTLGLDLDFIVPELTMAPRNPAMSELIPLYEASRKRAFEDAITKAKELSERLAA